MKRIQLEIKALSPLAISRQKPGGSVSECEDYIPGSVIRGAIASEILKQSGQTFANLNKNGDDFQALFLSDEPAIFQNAYPNVYKIDKNNFRIEEEVKILPATALSSKTNPGFTTDDKGNGVFDTLFDRFCADYYGYAYEPNCPTDGSRVDSPGIIFYSVFNDEYYKISSQKRLLTRVGINRRRATSEEEILYSIEVLSESESRGKNPKPVSYLSSIIVPDNLSDLLGKFIDKNSLNFRLGGSISRGLGKIEIQSNILEIQDNSSEIIKEKIEVFTHKLYTRWKNQWSIFGQPLQDLSENRQYFTLNLQADTILTEKWQRTTVITEKMLKEFTDVDDESLKLEAAYSSYDYRSGWNSAWGLMKDVELVTNKGSVYLFSTTQPKKWYLNLAELELRGVGERTYEGFGKVEICNAFHLVMREEFV
ncbi:MULTISPECIES: type III-D CRISPR-associated RAMP protein Csx10 [Calothrix]|uniref:CRISPR-associated RAMP protein Csx10 n=2 Tax=Calothrix TaxID=1186 RepID=A0ABR8A4K4_9CYAN|nr:MULTISPECIES: CRISPR-associated RAMP protein Csx10 [Calothrix]MBD2194836.1 CRISPR-associated RAMP protein Csx10 [Calothrix parietina FACHB-288]MBD2223434.1 CRISPR-associated RAMP protein Csx10 [Calothrix anomala FACHB-343]